MRTIAFNKLMVIKLLGAAMSSYNFFERLGVGFLFVQIAFAKKTLPK